MKLKALIVAFALVLTSVFIPTTAQAYEITGFDLNSQYVMFASLDSGEIMFESAADVRAYPASLTKIMTAIVVLENCDDVDKKLTVPQEAISSLIGTGSSIGGLKEGEQLSVRHLLQMLLRLLHLLFLHFHLHLLLLYNLFHMLTLHLLLVLH